MVGGSWDTPFEDPTPASQISKVVVRCGRKIDALRLEYADNTSTIGHGGTNGHHDYFDIEPDEIITTVYIWGDQDITSVQFGTSKARSSDNYRSSKFFGGWEGNGGKSGTLHTFKAPAGEGLIGFKGRAGDTITALEPIWGSPHKKSASGSNTSIGAYQGGSGGIEFDMRNNLHSNSKAILKTIIIRCAVEIDAIECIFRTGQGDQRSGLFGGGGGKEHTFRLYEGERIVRIEGRVSNIINRLQFFTNMNRHSEVYGGNGGSPVVWTPTKDSGMSLLCFHGRSAARVDGFAPVWSSDPTENCLQ